MDFCEITFLYLAFLLAEEMYLVTAQCDDTSCKNAGACIAALGQCICEAPFGGPTCEIINPNFIDTRCPNNINIGRCGVQCTKPGGCRDGRVCCADGNCGTVCFSSCDSNPCQNGGLCLSREIPEFICQCPAGFTGKTCETPTNPCNSSPCKNNGLCRSQGSQFTCQCRRSFKGRLCEERKKMSNCPPSRPEVPNCGRYKCFQSFCHRFTSLTCRVSKCGECKARFYNRFGQEVACDFYFPF